MLIHIRDLFKNYDSSFAYPAFNTRNLEITLGIIQAAEELDAPVILSGKTCGTRGELSSLLTKKGHGYRQKLDG